ncbi:MAG: hypothetical protein KC766_07415 [Myxococcales bacterium]|nr:hypothetical protein [Myxococcales bacterium]
MFDDYIVTSGAVPNDRLQQAFEARAARTPRVGQIAREMGMLSSRQVLELLDHQRTSTSRFCELAVEKRMLTERQVLRILTEQAGRRPALLEVLLDTGALTRAEVLELRRKHAKSIRTAPEHTGTRLKQLSREEFSQLAKQCANDRTT